jgi:hypothetical protein
MDRRLMAPSNNGLRLPGAGAARSIGRELTAGGDAVPQVSPGVGRHAPAPTLEIW